MPEWAIPVIKWVGERFLHVVIYGAIILGVGFLLYSAFLKPTNTQRTVVQAGGTQIEYWKDAKITPSFGGCVSLQAEKYKENK